jgi:hypothetical protein
MLTEAEIEKEATVALSAFRRLSGKGVKLGFDRTSLAWVESYIDSNRETSSTSEAQAFIGLVGVYLGECVRQAYGGSWKEKDGDWGIFFNDNSAAFPFNKARKLVENGLAAGDSITGLFDVLPVILKRAP